MSMAMAIATRRADAKPYDVFSAMPRRERQNFIKSLASVIGPE